MVNKGYDKNYAEDFLKGIRMLTGIPYKKLEKYADKNNLFNILEHPNTIEPNPQQLEKIALLNEFISTYRLLKMQEEENKITLNSSFKAGEYFSSMLSGTKNMEKFMVAFLDNGNNIIETRTMSEGGLGEAVVYPRNLLKAALDCDCKSMVISHNHPGGSLLPSQQDIDLTERLVSVFAPLEISILDHIIIAKSTYYSMAENGRMPGKNPDKASYQPMALGKEASANEMSVEFENGSESEVEEAWEV
jgi:DNA repair protein RadC